LSLFPDKSWKKLVIKRYLVLSAILSSGGDPEESLRTIHDYMNLDRKHAMDQIYRLRDEGFLSIEVSKKRGQNKKRYIIKSDVMNLVFQLSRAPYRSDMKETLQKYANDKWLNMNFPFAP